MESKILLGSFLSYGQSIDDCVLLCNALCYFVCFVRIVLFGIERSIVLGL